MKKMIFILTFFLFIYTPHIVYAEKQYNIIEEVESPEGFDVNETIEMAKEGKIPFSFLDILKKILSLFIGGIQQNIPNIIKMTSVAILSGLIVNLNGDKNEIGTYASVAIGATIAIKIFSYTITVTTETIDALFIFISSLMTPLATVASTGKIAIGAAAASIFVAMQVFIHICKSILIPLICVITVFSVGDKLGKTPYLYGITNILKQILKWGTGLMITIYTVVIGLQTQAASGLDSLAGKSIKYAVGSFVPVVGGALSDTLETVIASAKTMAGALGISGVLGVGYICIVPLINICTISLSFKLAGAIAAAVAEKRVTTVIDEFAQSIGRVSLVLISVTVMFIISLAMLCGFGE